MKPSAVSQEPAALATESQKPKAKSSYSPRLRTQYEAYAKELAKELGLKNVHLVPRIDKIVVNSGLGRAKDDKKVIEIAANTLSKITGQKPIETIAKNSIATFKLREGNKIGLKVTLRGDRMYEFMDRVINIILPRLRDFHGVPDKFDGQGNYSIGLVDQSVFPELSFEETSSPHGLQITFVIKAHEPAHSKALLEKFGMPFEKENK
ncbi:MAG: 50S ribosomal protein L5 [bacterium]|nr:50S ribosomal protein L5 [bacterium]